MSRRRRALRFEIGDRFRNEIVGRHELRERHQIVRVVHDSVETSEFGDCPIHEIVQNRKIVDVPGNDERAPDTRSDVERVLNRSILM